MRKFIMSLTTVASLSLAAVPILGLAQAANAGERTAHVVYGDLNLSNPAQAAIFKARVETAGQDLCRTMLRNGELAMTLRNCVANAHREAERQLPKAQRHALTFAASAPAVEVAAK